MITDHWPLFGLRVTTPRLELRVPQLEDFDGLLAAVRRGVHAPDRMPFQVPWTTLPEPDRARSVLQFYWGRWAAWSADDWSLTLAAFRDGVPIGAQEMSARRFAATREVSSGSWLERAVHGHGLGTEMRAGMLHLAFAGLDAEWAVSSAFLDNPASLAVSRKLGYADDGLELYAGATGPARPERRLRLSRTTWESLHTVPVEITGLDACRAMFGIEQGPDPKG